MERVALVNANTYELKTLFTKIEELFKLYFPGGFETEIPTGSTVLLKPNLLSEHKIEDGVTTNPNLIESIVRYLIDRGYKVRIGDSPCTASSINSLWDVTGVNAIAEKYKIELINFEKYPKVKVELDNKLVPYIYVSGALFDTDYVISIPKVKTHVLTTITGALKNYYGVIPGVAKSRYHKTFMGTDSFSKFIVDINKAVRPDLNIMDGIIVMQGNGPAGGELTRTDFIMMGKNSVAIDSVIARIMNIAPEKIKQIKIAHQSGLGPIREEEIQILGEKVSRFVKKDFKLPTKPSMDFMDRLIPRQVKNYFDFYLEINPEKCTKCMNCFKHCPAGAVFINKKSSDLKINRSKCIRCNCCREFCNFKAIDIKEHPIIKIVRKIISF